MLFFRIPERRRRSLLPLSAVVLAAVFFLVFRPMGQLSAKLDQPLAQTAQDLAIALGQPEVRLLDSLHITNQLRETQRSLAILQDTAALLSRRIELRAEIRARLQAPFELFDYQNERQIGIDDLTRLAEERQVKLDPSVLEEIPQHTIDTRSPALLWAKLEFLNHLAATALQNQVTAIHALRVPAVRSDLIDTNASPKLTAVPLYIELTGSMSHLSRFLRSLPLRAEEVKAAGLPEVAATKPPLFIDRLFLVKQSPLKPDEVRLSLEASGFVQREMDDSPSAP